MEKLYQYLWKHRMLGTHLKMRDGSEVRIINPGVLNEDAGPDFSGARIKIGDREWAGNVEIHVKASDWYRHSHDKDRAYDSIVLHVVSIDDMPVRRGDGSVIPQVQVTFPPEFFNIYASLSENIRNVRCAPYVRALSALAVEDWMETLAVERMQEKAARILDIHKSVSGDWERTCFITFARAMGFGLNSVPFEMFARTLPLNYLARHSDNLFQLEALLFGQAGMLDMSVNIFDEYYQGLCREYYFLARKYSLRPIRRELWKYARTRPGNFPHRRIALLASYLEGGFSLMSEILAARGDREKSLALFNRELKGYWLEHSGFGAEPRRSPAALSASSVEILLINLVAPMLYAHGASVGDHEAAGRGLALWEDLDGERNRYIRDWTVLGLKCDNAMRSQAMIRLRKDYCDCGRCLECRFGHAFLRRTVSSGGKPVFTDMM